MDRLLQDLRFAARSLAQRPAVAAVAILSFAIGIGANAAIFSVVDAVLLKPLSYAEPQRLVRLWETFQAPQGRWTGSVSTANFLDWQRQSEVFDALGAYSTFGSFNLRAGDDPIRVQGGFVTPEVLEALGVSPLQGRLFGRDDVQAGRDRVLILSHGLWQRRFGAERDLVGRSIHMNGESYTVVGIMPRSFEFPPRSVVELWVPLTFTETQRAERGSHWMQVLARLKPSVTLVQAQSAMDVIAGRLEQQYPDEQESRGVLLRTLPESVVGDTRAALFTLWGAVGFVLLISCANVANLLLSRSATRRRELAVRQAMGAGRAGLVRLLLSESLVLSLAGGAVGLAFGFFAVSRLSTLLATTLPVGQNLQVDFRVVAFALAASLVAATVSGLAPALRASRVTLNEGLRERTEAQSGFGRDRLRSALVVLEVALSLVVLVGAGLMARSFLRILATEPGLRPEGVLTLQITLPSARYSEPARVAGFYERLLENTRRLPGVVRAGLINVLPIQNWGWNGGFTIEGRTAVSTADQPFAEFRSVGAGYFEAMRIPLLAGRFPTDSDRDGRPLVAIANRALAQRYWPGESALGKRFRFEDGDPWVEIVGVSGDVTTAGLRRQVLPEIYMPMLQRPEREMSLVVHGAVEPTSLVGAIEREVRALDPEQPIHRVLTMNEVVRESVARERFNTLLLGLFGLVALLLAVAGVYAVLSYGVTQRTREIGVRMALGADRSAVTWLVVRQGLSLAGIGAVLGLLLSLGVTRLLASQLYGVAPTDPLTLAGVSGFLLVVSLVACYVPARRASRVDPMAALRWE